MNLFYNMMAKAYDLLDVIYFRNVETSPRTAVFERIYDNEKVLDVCTGTAANAIRIAKEKANTKIVGSFDKILISLVLHEIDEELADRIIKEAVRVLKSNGEIIIAEWEPSKKLTRKILFAPIHYLEPKTYHKFIGLDLKSYFHRYGLCIEEYIHCDYTRVVVVKKVKNHQM